MLLDGRERGFGKMHGVDDRRLDNLTFVARKFAGTSVLEEIENREVCAKDKVVDGSDEALLTRLAILLCAH